MAKTLLNGVNDVLKRMGAIKGNSGELSSLSDPQRQVLVDLAVACWNEVIIDLFESSEMTMPQEMGTSTLTLVTGDRDYSLPSDLVFIKWPLKNDSNGYRIEEYPGGWDQIRKDQLQPNTFTGRPFYAVVRPSDGLLYLDRIPTADDNGLQYTIEYDKSLIKSLATDTFPFSDDVYSMLVPAVVEQIKSERDAQSDVRYTISNGKRRKYIARASAMLSLQKQRTNYLPQQQYSYGSMDPFEEE